MPTINLWCGSFPAVIPERGRMCESSTGSEAGAQLGANQANVPDSRNFWTRNLGRRYFIRPSRLSTAMWLASVVISPFPMDDDFCPAAEGKPLLNMVSAGENFPPLAGFKEVLLVSDFFILTMFIIGKTVY